MKVIDRFDILSNLEKEDINQLKLEQIFTVHGGVKIPLSKLEIFYADKNGKITTREIKSIDDFRNNLFKKAVCVKGDTSKKLEDLSSTLYYEFVSPKTSLYDSHSINPKDEVIPYGLKRTLRVKEASDGETEKYLYVRINGRWEFLKKEQIMFIEDGVLKNFNEVTSSTKTETLNFFSFDGKTISQVYTAKEYTFDKAVAKETVDFDKNKKVSYYIRPKAKEADADGGSGDTSSRTDKKITEITVDDVAYEVVEEPVDYEQFITDQEFVEIDVPKPNSTKTMKVHKRKVVNYQSHVEGEFVAITVHGQTKMVKIENLCDELGNSIDNLSEMVGKKVSVKENDTIVATSDMLTYEQANRRYDTVKSHQLLDGLATDSSLLRLKDGKYVKELETVQPLSFKFVGDLDRDFDRYLVEQTVGGNKKLVIVDKDFFKRGPVPGFNLSTAKKLKRCAYAECDVVQTKSERMNEKDKKSAVQDCKVFTNVTIGDTTLTASDRNLEMDAFKESYKKDEYFIEDVIVDGEIKSIETPGKRYEYTDTVYLHDKAADSISYRALETQNMTFRDGKIKGAPRYNVGKGIADSYAAFGLPALGVALGAPVLGLFIPAIMPVWLLQQWERLLQYQEFRLLTLELVWLKMVHLENLEECLANTKTKLKQTESKMLKISTKTLQRYSKIEKNTQKNKLKIFIIHVLCQS